MMQCLLAGSPFPNISSTCDPYLWAVQQLILTIHQSFRDGDFESHVNDVSSFAEDGEILVAVRGRLLHIQNNYQVIEYASNYTAIGSGRDFALGALYSTSFSARNRVEMALEAAQEFDEGTRGPFIIEELTF